MKRRRLFGGCLAGACGAAMGTEAPPSPAVRSSPCSRSPLHAPLAPHHPLPLGQAHPSGASIPPSPPLHPCNVKFRGGRGAGSCVCLRGPGLSTVDDGLSRSRTGGQTRHRDASVRPAGQTDQDQELLRFQSNRIDIDICFFLIFPSLNGYKEFLEFLQRLQINVCNQKYRRGRKCIL